MKEISAENYDESVKEGLVVVEAWAEWCSQCPRMMSILEQLEPEFEGKIKFVKFSVGENMELGQKLGVMTLPTMFLYKDGILIDQKSGIIAKNEFRRWLEAAL